jgi:hypothetical protein
MSIPSITVWGIAFQYRPVHEGPGITFVGVADDVLGVALRVPGEAPLHTGREARTSPAPQARPGHLVDDLFGGHDGEHLRDGEIPIAGNVIIHFGRVDAAAVSEDDLHLIAVEGHVLFVGDPLAGDRFFVKDLLEGLAFEEGLFHDLGYILRRDLLVEITVRVYGGNRGAGTEAVAARLYDIDFLRKSVLGEARLEGVANLDGAEGTAPGHADTDPKPVRIATFQYRALITFEFPDR